MLLHPAFANLLSISEMPDPGPVEIAMMALICLCVGLINGIYPALVLSRVKPVAVLKSVAAQSRLRRFNLRSLLVAGQFCFAIILLVVTLGLNLQLWVTRNQPLGFDVKNLALANVNFELLKTRNDIGVVFANELSTVPGISAVSPMLFVPAITNGSFGPNVALVNTQQDSEGVPIKGIPVQPGLFDLLGIPLLAGRDLNAGSDVMPPPQPESQEPPPVRRVIINRTALKALAFTEPNDVIGKQYYQLNDNGARRAYVPIEIVGVVEDSMLSSVRERPGAQFYYMESFAGGMVLLRYDDTAASTIAKRVSDVAQEVTGAPIELTFLNERVAQVFSEEQRESRLLLMCTGLALFLSCVGLYGLVSVALKTQVKEIGVRKVLGASTFGVVKTFLSRFSVPVFTANLIAWPVAAYSVFAWIERFPYQLEKIWLLPICLAATALVLLIAWITVGVLTFRAASTPPVRSLRYE
jgi:putative ABC transport system permease protein